jgi:hypothetical protein
MMKQKINRRKLPLLKFLQLQVAMTMQQVTTKVMEVHLYC